MGFFKTSASHKIVQAREAMLGGGVGPCGFLDGHLLVCVKVAMTEIMLHLSSWTILVAGCAYLCGL